MNFVVIGKDKGSGELRKAARADHLDFISGRQDLFVYAGPLLEEGRMVGSLFVLDVPDRGALDEWLGGDPYFARGIFETVEIFESRWMVPERAPGVLAAEAKSARSA
jgi:uncharacterized protein YciI